MRPSPTTFPDGQRLYAQVRWDARFDPDLCEIVLLDRHAGRKTIAFHDFLPNGPVPWHRIVGFLYSGRLLWDRASRVDARADVLARLRARSCERTRCSRSAAPPEPHPHT